MKLYTGKERGWYEKEESSSNGDQFTSYHRFSGDWIVVFL